MPDDVTYSALAVSSRRRLLEVLRAADGPLDLPALAAAIGLHPNTVRFHLDVLLRAGLIEEQRQQRSSRGRPRILYAPTVLAGHDEGYQLLAGMLVRHLDEAGPAHAAEHAGRAWARRIKPTSSPQAADLAATTRTVMTLFTEMGFDPATARGHGNRINLRGCPFRELAEAHPAVVCTLHLGLLREFVERRSAGTLNATLSPFVQPRLCVVDLAATTEPATA